MDQSSPVSRKFGSNFKNCSPNNCLVFELLATSHWNLTPICRIWVLRLLTPKFFGVRHYPPRFRTRRVLRSIIESTPILWFKARASNAFSGNGGVMYSGPQVFCFWTQAHQIWGHSSTVPGLSENAEKVDQSSPIPRKTGPKLKIRPQKSRPQGV